MEVSGQFHASSSFTSGEGAYGSRWNGCVGSQNQFDTLQGMVLQFPGLPKRSLVYIPTGPSPQRTWQIPVFAREFCYKSLCHHGMARPRVADGGDGLQIVSVAAKYIE
jgi:hypothetical protein